ncbi:hypothetical protein [Paenibacillus xylanexedens]|uniref:hypothetical protein n=1 Tax=Paenibacillus xylanexedens TaxID=528191 RepID=UPI0011A2EE99|nr:hypothetical protein [Paenibacillus xylanexedens]
MKKYTNKKLYIRVGKQKVQAALPVFDGMDIERTDRRRARRLIRRMAKRMIFMPVSAGFESRRVPMYVQQEPGHFSKTHVDIGHRTINWGGIQND